MLGHGFHIWPCPAKEVLPTWSESGSVADESDWSDMEGQRAIAIDIGAPNAGRWAPQYVQKASVSSSAASSSASATDASHWPAPNQEQVDQTTREYTRPGREHFPMPKSIHVVLGHRTAKKYAAYCELCDTWFDWPPLERDQKMKWGRPCEHAL